MRGPVRSADFGWLLPRSPHSGKQSYFDIALIFHDIFVLGELFKPDCCNN